MEDGGPTGVFVYTLDSLSVHVPGGGVSNLSRKDSLGTPAGAAFIPVSGRSYARTLERHP
jgi:hypothetical protein